MPLARRILLAGLVAAAPLAAFAQAPPRATVVEGSATQEVLALRERIRAAIAKKDRAALAAAYAENFMHLRDSGRADLKQERIALLLSGEQTIETAPEDGLAVQLYGRSTAVATGTSAIRDPAAGKAVPFRWLVVYVKGESGWQVAASQASRVPARR